MSEIVSEEKRKGRSRKHKYLNIACMRLLRFPLHHARKKDPLNLNRNGRKCP